MPQTHVFETAVPQMVLITGGEHRPLYMKDDTEPEVIEDFRVDRVPVTNQEYVEFVSQNPQWQPDEVPSLFTESGYLRHWHHDDVKGWGPTVDGVDHPVVNVSWFAASAYCEAQGKRLPKVSEWEYIGSASETSIDGGEDVDYNQKILDWYARPTRITAVGSSEPNYWGVNDLHGLIWEWTEDFNNALTSGESRADSSVNTDLYCAAAAAGSTDPSDYAAFLRYGFRSSLKGDFVIKNLGFRCAADIASEGEGEN